MGRGRPKKRKDPPADNIDEPEPKSSKQKERGHRETSARSNKINYKVFVDSESSDEEDPNVCPLCEDRNDPSGKKNRMIGCDGCDKWFHWSCVGINQKNKPGKKDDWFCPDCRPKQNGEVIPTVKTLAQKKSFDVTDKRTKYKEPWITSSKEGTNNSAENHNQNRKETETTPASYEENGNDYSKDELSSHQASSSSQKSSKPSDIIHPSGVDDSIFQDFLSENPLVISEEPEIKLKIQLSKKTDFKGCAPVETKSKPEAEPDSWKTVVDSSGARGLKLVPSPEKKESSSPVIKDIDGHSVTDGSDSNQHSTSRLSGGGEGEVRENKPLVKGMDFPNVLDELFNSDLPTNSIKTQQDEAKIQSITKNLEATGASILQQSQHNYSHPLPNILTQPRNDAMLSPSLHSVTAALNSASNLSTNTLPNQYSVPVDHARLLHQGNNQNDLISKAMDGAGLKILSPIRLNEKHVNVPGSNSPGATEPGRVLVQHQRSGLAQATGAPALSAQNGAQPNSIFLSQNKPVVSPITSLSGPLTSIALASVSVPLSGLPVSGVVISHPAQVRPGLASVVTTQVRPGLSLASNTVGPGVSVASLQMGPGGVSPQAQVRPGALVASPLAPGASPTVRPPLPGVRIVRPVRGSPVRMRGRGEMRLRMVRPPGAGAPGTPPGVRGPRPRGPSPRGRGMRGAPRGQLRPGVGSPRLVRPGAPRQVRPGTPMGPRPARPPMAGTPRGPRPTQTPAQPPAPSPLRPPAPSPAASAAVKPEVIDLSDDEEAPAPAKSFTLDKLRACGISVSKQKAPQLPSNVRLPPGISLSGSSNPGPKRSSVSSSDGDGANKRVALDHNVASALTAVGGSSNEPKQRVELELSDKQMNALRALGLL